MFYVGQRPKYTRTNVGAFDSCLESIRDQLLQNTENKAGKLLKKAILGTIEVKYIGGFADKLGDTYIVPIKID